ncbi:hypothetical protein CR513_22679, partial [Mucuna pruriens]
PSHLIFKPSKIIFNQSNLQIPCTIARNSAAALDRATTFCFLLLQVTKFPPRMVQYLVMDLLSITDLHSQHQFRLQELFTSCHTYVLKQIYDIFMLRYKNTLLGTLQFPENILAFQEFLFQIPLLNVDSRIVVLSNHHQ